MQQNADNNLESFLMEDFVELATNSMIQSNSDNQYFYALFDRHEDQTTADLNHLQHPDGSLVSGEILKPMKIKLEDGQMTLVEVMNVEVDMDTISVFQNFVDWGYNACKDASGDSIDQHFLVMSSHGAGVIGFGGDEGGNSDQILDIMHIRQAIMNVMPGLKFDLIGFDACVMQSVGVAGALVDVTRTVLASMALEPGHGWDFTCVDPQANTTLDWATKMIDCFADNTQGQGQQPGKTLSLVNTENQQSTDNCNPSGPEPTFMCVWDTLLVNMTSRLMAGDNNLFVFITQARLEASSFTGIQNESTWTVQSVMDVSSFCRKLREQQLLVNDPILIDLDAVISNIENNAVHYARQGLQTNDLNPSYGLAIVFIPIEQKRNQYQHLSAYQVQFPHMQNYDSFLRTQQEYVPKDYSDPEECTQVPGYELDCTEGPQIDNSEIQKEIHSQDENNIKMEACLYNYLTTINQLSIKRQEGEFKRVVQMKTKYSMCKSKSEFDNYLIALYSNSVLNDQVFINRTESDQQSIPIWIYNLEINPETAGLKDPVTGNLFLFQGNFGEIQVEFNNDGTYALFNIFKYGFNEDFLSGTMTSLIQLPNDISNWILPLNETFQGKSVFKLVNSVFRKIHMKQLTEVSHLRLEQTKVPADVISGILDFFIDVSELNDSNKHTVDIAYDQKDFGGKDANPHVAVSMQHLNQDLETYQQYILVLMIIMIFL